MFEFVVGLTLVVIAWGLVSIADSLRALRESAWAGECANECMDKSTVGYKPIQYYLESLVRSIWTVREVLQEIRKDTKEMADDGKTTTEEVRKLHSTMRELVELVKRLAARENVIADPVLDADTQAVLAEAEAILDEHETPPPEPPVE